MFGGYILAALKEGISSCASFAGLMKQIPPMVRIAIANLICRGLGESEGNSFWNRRIHYSLGYGERAYGCSEEVGRSYGDALEIFQTADVEGMPLPSSITKAVLVEGLTSHGVAVRKSAKRDELVELARAIPGLLQELFAKCEPDVVVVRSEYADEALCWSRRYRALTCLGRALLTCMGMAHLRCSHLSATFDEVLRTLVALKNSPIWQALGDGVGGYNDTLGNPYPPFAFDSGMAWVGVDRSECIKLGLVKKHE